MFLSNFSQRLKFSMWVQHIDESCPRLSTQVVFTAAFLKIPRTYLSCSCLLSLVRECANCCGVVCPRKLFWKRELYRSRGDNNGVSRCLVLCLVSNLSATSLAHCTLSFYIFHNDFACFWGVCEKYSITLGISKTRKNCERYRKRELNALET